MTTTLRPSPVDPSTLDDADLSDLNDHLNRIRLERDPDFPPRPLSETRAWVSSLPGFLSRRFWWIRDGAGRVVAHAISDAWDIDNNRHFVEVDIGVDLDHRRRGLATALLGEMAAHARAIDRRLMLFATDSRIPSGEGLAKAIGAEAGLRAIASRVVIAHLDRELLRTWREHGETHATDFGLVWFDGPYPEDWLTEMSDLIGVMNDAPTEQLDVGDFELSAQQLRQDEESLEARGIERWTLVAAHRPSGRAAGFTQVYWNPTIPHLAQQGDTGVRPEYRGHRLGRWLKASMAERIVAERPRVTAIQTENAGSNEPMLAINRAMGFREHMIETIWQIDVEAVLGRDPTPQPS